MEKLSSNMLLSWLLENLWEKWSRWADLKTNWKKREIAMKKTKPIAITPKASNTPPNLVFISLCLCVRFLITIVCIWYNKTTREIWKQNHFHITRNLFLFLLSPPLLTDFVLDNFTVQGQIQDFRKQRIVNYFWRVYWHDNRKKKWNSLLFSIHITPLIISSFINPKQATRVFLP